MAAMLEKNDASGKPLADPGLPANEIVQCPVGSCPISYTLAYGQTENRIEGNQNVRDVIRRMAWEQVKVSHPHPRHDDSYIWAGIRRGWLDREAAKAAGL